jgi:hypothetical protein
VSDGTCLLDHPVDMSTTSASSGRRLRPSPSRRTKRTANSRPDVRTALAPNPPPISTERVVDLVTMDDPRVNAFDRERELVSARAGSPGAPYEVAPPGPTSPIFEDDIDVDDEDLFGPESAIAIDVGTAEHALLDIAPTGGLIAALWARDEVSPPAADWETGQIEPRLLDARRIPRSILVLALLVLVLAAGWIVRQRLVDDPAARTAALASNALGLSAALDGLNPVLADMSDGSMADLVSSGSLLSEVDAASRRMLASAARIEPDDVVMADVRRLASDLATASLGAKATVADLIGYGTGIGRIVGRPGFPSTAAPDQLPGLTEEVVGWAVMVDEAASMLPQNPLLEPHREAVDAYVATIGTWQETYLDAVRSGDSDTSARLVEELAVGLGRLSQSWETEAGDIVGVLDSQIEMLRTRMLELTRRR